MDFVNCRQYFCKQRKSDGIYSYCVSAEQYVEVLGTYSDHIAIEQSIRDNFFDEIKDTINKHGGSIIIYDTIDLQLSRKMCGLSI